MTGRAPLTKKDQAAIENITQPLFMDSQPRRKLHELSTAFAVDILTSVLREKSPVTRQRQAYVGTIKLLFDLNRSCKQLLYLWRQKHLIIA